MFQFNSPKDTRPSKYENHFFVRMNQSPSPTSIVGLSGRLRSQVRRWKTRPPELTFAKLTVRNAAARLIQTVWRQRQRLLKENNKKKKTAVK
jgi:hypothetical protein